MIGGKHFELNQILETMNVPYFRRNLYTENVLWLKRNLGIQNNQHEKFDRAMQLIIEILREDENK